MNLRGSFTLEWDEREEKKPELVEQIKQAFFLNAPINCGDLKGIRICDVSIMRKSFDTIEVTAKFCDF